MPETHAQDWTPFSVGPAPTGKQTWKPDCRPLEVVHHVTHVRYACDVLKDGRIFSRPVYDDSILNTTRTHVVWLSPNDWTGAGGSRYGGIEFSYDWKQLIQDREPYWVGRMAYSPPAVRILLTKKDPPASLNLKKYDPTLGDGPWWHRTTDDTHWWNGDNLCLELMLETDDLPLGALSVLGSTKHHKLRCNMKHVNCGDAGEAAEDALARFGASVIHDALPHHNAFSQYWPSLASCHDSVLGPVLVLCNSPNHHLAFGGPVQKGNPLADSLGRAAFGAIATRRLQDLQAIGNRFATAADFEDTCRALVVSGIQ